MIKNWIAKCKCGRIKCSGRPKTVTVPDMIEKVHRNVLDNRRVKVSEILGTSKDSEHIILIKEMEMKTYSKSWVPGLLTPRTEAKTESLERFPRPFGTFSPQLTFAQLHNGQ